jgi:GxxExxY protein
MGQPSREQRKKRSDSKRWIIKLIKSLEPRLRFTTSSGAVFSNRSIKEALELEFGDRCIPFRPQVETPVLYKGRKLKAPYRADFYLLRHDYRRLKALAKLGEIESTQVLNYLKASAHERGLLINFGARSPEHRRFVWSHEGPKGQKIE